MSPTVHIVPHTHWDREWYRPAAQFQLRLAHLVDGVLDLLDKKRLPSFLLDGQGVVLDDYAAARPTRLGRLGRLARHLASGKLECGPWYVLADNLLVSAEAMVRNLLEGGRAVGRYGGTPMRVGYAPDTFGHPAILPTILAGFGIRNAVTWRGFGGESDQAKDLYCWLGPDGSEVVMIHLPPQGYENGANLPTEAAAAKTRWSSLRATMEARASSPHWLVMNGADHHVAQADLMAAVKRLEALAPDCRFVVGSFSAYARAVESWAARHPTGFATIRGELREGRRHAWSLQGTHSARLYLKQANAACQRLLERVAEPLVALSEARGERREWGGARQARGLREDLQLAWCTLLENHPHDSICGTSGDDVHREMMTRFERCRAMAEEIVERAADAAVGFDPNAARTAGRTAWRPALLVFNPSPRARSCVIEANVALFESDVKVGQQGATTKPGARRRRDLAIVGAGGAALPMQELSREEGYDRLESPRYYPDCDAVEWRRVAIEVEDLPPLGLQAFSVVERAVRKSARPPVRPVEVSDFAVGNERVAACVEPDGTVTLTDKVTGRSATGLGAIECVVDEGDSYTSSPRGPDLTAAPDAVAVRVIHGGPLRGELEVVRRWDAAATVVTTRVQLDAGVRHVVLSFAFENAHGNRRVRAAFPLGEDLVRVVADGPFGPVDRPVVGPRRRPGDLEAPDPCAPMQRYVSVAGLAGALTVFSDGLPQYEARDEGTVFVTLLRAFDQMSRADIPERLGHAGWPTPTPEARTLGAVHGRLAVMLHGPASIDAREQQEAAAEAFLSPPIALMRRALLSAPPEVRGPALSGEGLVFSAMKPAESGRGTILRCYNSREKAARGAWQVGWPVKSATLCRLDETPLKKLQVERGGMIRFDAPSRGVVTVLLR